MEEGRERGKENTRLVGSMLGPFLYFRGVYRGPRLAERSTNNWNAQQVLRPSGTTYFHV